MPHPSQQETDEEWGRGSAQLKSDAGERDGHQSQRQPHEQAQRQSDRVGHYHGVLAPNAGLRERVTALGRVGLDAPRQPGGADPDPPTPARSAARFLWARLLARIYEVFPLRCPDCGAEMRILAFLTDPFTVAGILRHLGLPTSAPPLPPARSPPPEDPSYDADPFLDLDQTPAFESLDSLVYPP